MFKKIKNTYYNIKYGIENLVRWIPTIWQLRDWDAFYIYGLISKHLSHVEDCMRNYGNGINSIKYADQIRIAKNLSKRLYDDNYLENALIPVEEKYGELQWHFEKDNMPGFNRLIFDESEEAYKARRNSYEHSEYLKKQDKEMLFEMLEKFIEKWWD
jgi:hypothetical protein